MCCGIVVSSTWKHGKQHASKAVDDIFLVAAAAAPAQHRRLGHQVAQQAKRADHEAQHGCSRSEGGREKVEREAGAAATAAGRVCGCAAAAMLCGGGKQ